MTAELKIGDIVECLDTHQCFEIYAFHPRHYHVVMVKVVDNASAGFLYAQVGSLVKHARGYLQFVHVPGAADKPSFLWDADRGEVIYASLK